MSLDMRCVKTRRSIELSAGGMLRLRRLVASRVSPEFQAHYDQLLSLANRTPKEREILDDKTMWFIRTHRVSIKVVDFLLQSDIEGRIRYGACKQILKLIGDYDDETLIYSFVTREHPTTFHDFKTLLQDCVATQSDLAWR